MANKIIDWNEVKKFHKTVAGINASNGKVYSLLVNVDPNAPYPNQISKDEIVYYFGSSTQFWAVEALINSVGKKQPIRVFQKLAVNKWQDLGNWFPVKIADEEEDGFWAIYLKPEK